MKDGHARTTASSPTSLRALLREPLVVFLIVGAGLFALHQAVLALRGDGEIVVPASVRATAVTQLKAALGREPTAQELQPALDRWLRDEALYREGLRLGLDRADPIIRDRVVHKTLSTTELSLPTPQIDDAELLRWFNSHPERYVRPPTFNVEVLTLDAAATDAEVARALDHLNNPQAPIIPQGRLHMYRDAPEGLLKQAYGGPMVDALHTHPKGRWVRSPAEKTVLLVKVQQVQPGASPSFESIQGRVRDDWRRERQSQDMENALNRLVQKYRVRYAQEAP